MTGEQLFGILLVIIFLLIVMRPMLQRWLGPALQRWMFGKMEDRMRRMAGMPTRKEERKARKQAQKREKKGAEGFRRAAEGKRTSASSTSYGGHPSDLQTYAEDVEFTEIKTFSADIKIGTTDTDSKETTGIEQQIEDVEFTEIKIKSKPDSK